MFGGLQSVGRPRGSDYTVGAASLFRLVPEHIASRALVALAHSAEALLDEMGRLTRSFPHPPASVNVFGSFARREADAHSDIDVVVRPTEVDEEDGAWIDSLDAWRSAVRRLSGNIVEVLEVSADEAATKLRGASQVSTDIRRDGQVVHGLSIDELRETRIG